MKKYLLLLLIPTLALAAGRLQNSDFMTEAEITGAGGAVSQLLNDNKIYVTAGGLNKTLDDAIVDGDIGTPLTAKGNLIGYGISTEECVLDKTDGKLLTVDSTATCGFDFKDPPVALPDQTGEAGKFLYTSGVSASWQDVNSHVNFVNDNILECGDFRACAPDGVITTSGFDISGVTTRSSEVPAYNISKLNLTTVAAATLDYTVTKTANFDGKQMMAYCEIKTANTGVTFSSMKDGIVQSTLNVSSDNSWRYYRIPFVGGATSQGFKIDHVTGAEIPDIDVANCFLGKDANLTQELGQAHFVGKLNLNYGSCFYDTFSSTYSKLVSTSSCSGITKVGSLQPLSNIQEMGVNIPNFRIDGTYKVVFSGLIYGSATSGQACEFNISKNSIQDTSNSEVYINGNTILNSLSGIEADIKFNIGDSGDIFFLGHNTNNTDLCRIYGGQADTGTISVHFYPDANSTVVTQDTELTAKTANEFTAVISGAASLASQNFDWITSVVNTGVGITEITTSLDNFAYGNYSCNANSANYGKGMVTAFIGSPSTGKMTVYSYDNLGNSFNSSYNITCERIANYNKSATIVGKFEQVESVMADLTAETANEFSGIVASNKTDISNTNFDVMTCSSFGVGQSQCTYSSGIFTTIPIVNVTVNSGSGVCRKARVFSTTSTGFIYNTFDDAGNVQDCAINYMITRGTDYNKNISGAIINASKMQQEIADIVATNTASADLCVVEASGNTGIGITADVDPINFNETSDNCNSFASNNTFTANKGGSYLIKTATHLSVVHTLKIYVDSGAGYNFVRFSGYTPTNNVSYTTELITLNAGDKVQLRSGASGTLQNNTTTHYLSIQELPDTASIIKNLNDNNTTKCQTKRLSGNVDSTGDVADFQFNNLVIGKRYRVYGAPECQEITATNEGSRGCVLTLTNNSVEVAFAEHYITHATSTAYRLRVSLSFDKTFVAGASTLITNFQRIGSQRLYGNTNLPRESITLCELPDSVIETTEF